jgi:hypothetical protein
MTYKEYKDARQGEFNDLPVHWAFGEKQFNEMVEKLGVSADNKLVSIGAGGYILKKDLPLLDAFMGKKDQLPELMKDPVFAEDAIYYEMCDHEYAINWQRNWDVLSCFSKGELKYYEDDYSEAAAISKYFDDLGWTEETKGAFFAARKRYFKDARKNDWF